MMEADNVETLKLLVSSFLVYLVLANGKTIILSH